MLQQVGLEDVDSADLSKRMEKLDLTSGDTEGIVGAIASYLKEAAGMAAEEVEEFKQQGQMMLASVLPSLGIVSNDTATETNGASEASGEKSNGEVANGESHSKTVIIEDVKAFKASMPLSTGVRPVKDMSEFEELEAKL